MAVQLLLTEYEDFYIVTLF